MGTTCVNPEGEDSTSLIFLLQKVFVGDTVQVTLSSVLDPCSITKKFTARIKQVVMI